MGTIICENGSRTSDLRKRIKDCNGVINEIVELCKCDAISYNRFKYMFTLVDSCFISKFKHGCEMWDTMYQKDIEVVEKLVPQMVKRVLELPSSTPTNVVIHDFGLISLVREVEMEKILLTSNTFEMDDCRIAKRLLVPMMEKEVPGYCSHVHSVLRKFGVSLESLQDRGDKRDVMKKILVEYEKKQLLQSMLKGSKSDNVLMNFNYDGKMLWYLRELPFVKARIVFMFRARMFLTRVNFQERWTTSKNCMFCGILDTDEHLFTCWGYMDLLDGMVIDHNMFYNLKDVSKSELSDAADVLLKIYRRLEICQGDKDFSGI